MITFERTVTNTTYDVAKDVQAIIDDIQSARVPKTQVRVFFVAEDHWLLFDQQRRDALARALSQLSRPTYPIYPMLERGLQLPVDLSNLYQEQAGMHASFLQRNADIVDAMLAPLVESHTVPDFVVFFGENHEANQGGNAMTGMQHLLQTGIEQLIQGDAALGKAITQLRWYSYRSAASCIVEEKVNLSVRQKVKLNDDCFLGFVEYDAASIDHNMLLAEKCLVKSKYFVQLRTRAMITTGDWWELYTTDDDSGYKAVKGSRRELYGDTTKIEIESVNPSLLIRAVRAADSPRKTGWKELGRTA